MLADLGDASKAAKDKAASAKETLSEASAGIDAADESLGQMGETATAMQKTLSDFSAFALPAVTAGLDDITQASNDATSAAGASSAPPSARPREASRRRWPREAPPCRRAASWPPRCATRPRPSPPTAAIAPPWRLWPTPGGQS